MKTQENERERKAQVFNSLLAEHDKLSREVSLIKSKFDLTRDDENQISSLTKEMNLIQKKAASLGGY